ncbi:pro-neuregulin-2, membrane-bound isoform-like [Arapaima gigas]
MPRVVAHESASGGRSRWHGHSHRVCRCAAPLEPVVLSRRVQLRSILTSSSSCTSSAAAAASHCSTADSDTRAKAGGMRLDALRFSMLLIGVSFACYSPSLNSPQDQAYRSAVVIEGRVHSVPANVSTEPYSVDVKVLDVWPLHSGGLEREQLVTVGHFGSQAPCTRVKKNHKYIFFMDPTDQPLVFKASFAPLDTSRRNLKKDVGSVLCPDCGTSAASSSCAAMCSTFPEMHSW